MARWRGEGVGEGRREVLRFPGGGVREGVGEGRREVPGWLPCHPLMAPGTLLPQGLCLCCAFYLERFPEVPT